MAITIKSIPTLENKVASAFMESAQANYSEKKASVDFSQEVKSADKILAKAKVK